VTTPDASQRAPQAPPPPAGAADEISLRELYLVLKRRSPWIGAATLLVALVAFIAMTTRPSVYVAEGTTAVARAPISIEASVGSSLRFTPEVTITFETYQTLAFSRGVLEAVLAHHEADDLARLEGALTLERIAGTANQPSTFLAVAHSVRSSDPGRAARAAEAWVDATVATVRALMLENLDTLEAITSSALADARANVINAELALEAVWAERAPDALRRHITSLDGAIADLERRRIDLLGERQARSAERDAFAAHQGDTGNSSWVVLMDAPDVAVDLGGALASLDARIAALDAEFEGAAARLEQLRAQRSALALERADVNVAIAELERLLRDATQAVDLLATFEPNVAYVAQVAPSGVRVLSAPSVPTRPEPTRAALIALLAAVVTAFAGVVVALLAEAVRPPSAIVQAWRR